MVDTILRTLFGLGEFVSLHPSHEKTSLMLVLELLSASPCVEVNTSIATHLATAVAVDVDANSDTA